MTRERYHIWLGERRTTVSLDNILSDYLALALGTTPQSPAAHQAVRQWLQHRLDLNADPHRCRVSQWLQGQAIEHISDNKLSDAYTQWLLGAFDYTENLTLTPGVE